MKGLMIKDFINMRKYAKTVLLVIAFYVLFSFMMEDTTLLSGMIVLMFSMTAIASFSYDSLAGWDEYAVSLPVSRKTIVKSKYVLSILLALFGMVLSALLGIILTFIRKNGDIAEQLAIAYAIFGISIFFLSILLPLTFKFGVEKSRIFMLAVVAIPTAVVFVLGKTGTTLPSEAQFGRILLYSPIMLAALYVFSYMLSYYFFEKKEL